MSPIKERIQIQDDNTVFKIMPGIHYMAVHGIEEGMHHSGVQNYHYKITPIAIKGQRLNHSVCVHATIQQTGLSPYIVRDMILETTDRKGKPFGRVVIKHNLLWGDAGFVPEAGQALYHDYATNTTIFEHDGSLGKKDSTGKRQLVGDGVRFDDDGISVAIDASGIAVRMFNEAFADISFDQSHVPMTVEEINQDVCTYTKELHFI